MEQNQTFNQIYSDTRNALLRYLIPRIKNSGDVEDLMQEIYRKLYLHLLKRGSVRQPLPYLYGIAKHELSRFYRGRAKRRTMEIEQHDFLNENIADESPLPEEQVLERDLLRQAWDIVSHEPLLSYQVFTLYYGFDVPTAEIADELGITEEAVRKRLSRTRIHIKEALSNSESNDQKGK